MFLRSGDPDAPVVASISENIPTFGGADARVHWTTGSSAAPLVLPPGTYDIFWKQDYAHTAERVKADVVVKEGELVEVPLK